MEQRQRHMGYDAVAPAAPAARRPAAWHAGRFARACCCLLAAAATAAVLLARGSQRAGAAGAGDGGSRLPGRIAALAAALSATAAPHPQQLVAQPIPGSGNWSVVPDSDPPDLCTVKPDRIVSTSPAKWWCAEPAHRVTTCSTCAGSCLSPASALHNLAVANASEPFVGWNPQGGGLNSTSQALNVKLPGSGQIIRAILWANAGDVEHDPAWIKVWSSYSGEDWKLIDTIDTTGLQGDSSVTVLPLPGNLEPTSETRAKYWSINPGGIELQSIPRSVGLCTTPACTQCGAPRHMFNWASDQPGSTYSLWLARQPPSVEVPGL